MRQGRTVKSVLVAIPIFVLSNRGANYSANHNTNHGSNHGRNYNGNHGPGSRFRSQRTAWVTAPISRRCRYTFVIV